MNFPVPSVCAISHFNRDTLNSRSQEQTEILGECIGQRLIEPDIKFQFSTIALLGRPCSGKTTLAKAIFNEATKNCKVYNGEGRMSGHPTWQSGINNHFGISISDHELVTRKNRPLPVLKQNSCQIIEHLPQGLHAQCDAVIYFEKAGFYGRDINIYSNPKTLLGRSLQSVLTLA